MEKDLLSLLSAAFDEACRKEGRDVPAGLAEFVSFGQAYLAAHPAVATYVARVGLGLRLADGRNVPLLPAGAFVGGDVLQTGTINLAQATAQPNIQPSPSLPITGRPGA